MKIFFRLVVLFIAMILASCGGSGGGGDSSGSETGVRILNGSIEAPPIELMMEGLSGDNTAVKFAEAGTRFSITGEAVNISGKSKASGNIVAGVSVPAERNGSYSLLIYGPRSGGRFNAKLLNDIVDNQAPSTIKIRVVNAVNKSAGITASLNSGAPFLVEFGEASPYQSIQPGTLNSVIKTLGGSIISNRTFDAGSGNKFTLLITGEEDYLVFSRLIVD